MFKIFPVKNLHYIVLLALLICNQNLNAQGLLGKITNTVHDLKNMTREIAGLEDQLRLLHFTTVRTTEEFNKNVKVSKGNDSQDIQNIPAKKLNQPVFDKDEFANLKWEPVNYFDGQLFPSSIICMSNYSGNLQGQLEAASRPVGFKILSFQSNIPVKWEIECVDKKFFDKVGGTVLYKDVNKDTYVMPVIPCNYENLAKQVSSVPVSVYYRLYDDKGNKVEKLVSLTIRSINDCIFRYNNMPMDFLFAGFVQEKHPEVDKILKQALDTKLIKAITGYQSGENYVDWQVAAIWRVLHERGFQYSSITTTSGDGDGIVSQQVRTFDNAIKTNQANCVDGTIVFASVLRAIGIHSVFVLIPGHCFLGYYTDDAKTKIKYVETTMLSKTTYVDRTSHKTISLDGAKTNDEKNNIYIGLFLAAADKALIEYKESQLHSSSLTEVDIDAMRDLVKTPIPFYN